MSAAGLGEHRYGKSRIRVVHVDRTNDARHIVTELSVDVYLWGDFARSFLKGDNSTTVPTDTMKNTVYALAKIHPVTPVESFAQAVANHFKTKYKQGTSPNDAPHSHPKPKKPAAKIPPSPSLPPPFPSPPLPPSDD